MPCTGKKNAPTFSFCVIKCVEFWLCHVNMKEKVRKRPCIPQEASQTAHFDPPGSLALHGRSGSVSRRDHNQSSRNPRPTRRGRKLGGSVEPIPRRPLHSAGRGGSVSRRDHNQLVRKPRPTRRGRKLGGRVKPYSPLLFGREGSGGEALLSEKPLPRNAPTVPYTK